MSWYSQPPLYMTVMVNYGAVQGLGSKGMKGSPWFQQAFVLSEYQIGLVIYVAVLQYKPSKVSFCLKLLYPSLHIQALVASHEISNYVFLK